MEEKTLLKVALICALLGILILIFISDKITYSSSNIASINSSMLEKEVLIKGQITSIQQTPNLLILTVKDDTSEIKVVAFKETTVLEKNQVVEILGTVKEYKSKLEIEAKRIRIF